MHACRRLDPTFKLELMHRAALILQALAQVYLGPMDGSHFVQPEPERVTRQLSAAAAAAYAAGVEALLLHEAALQRNVRSRCNLFCLHQFRHVYAGLTCATVCTFAELCHHLPFHCQSCHFSVCFLCTPASQHCRYMHLYSCHMRRCKVEDPWPDAPAKEQLCGSAVHH